VEIFRGVRAMVPIAIGSSGNVVQDFALCLLAEEATNGSHRKTTNIAKDKQHWNAKPGGNERGLSSRSLPGAHIAFKVRTI